jgi:hypothetical protein
MPRAKLPTYERAEHPPRHVLTERDKHILLAIYEREGMLTDTQVAALFFDSLRRAQERLSLLFHNGYVERFDHRERASYGFMGYFLDTLGVEVVAQLKGVLPAELKPRSKTERTSLIPHDAKLNDVRIAIEQALQSVPGAQLMRWNSSRQFYADHDRIPWIDEQGRKRKPRGIRPDAYFHIQTGERSSRNLLELDLRTEFNKRFVVEKVLPGLAYVNSPEYKIRFGENKGRWLVVTTGEERMRHMIRMAEAMVGQAAQAFYYTTLAHALEPGAFFNRPIWHRPTKAESVWLFGSSS